MDHATLVGIDLGKHSFHLHGQDRNGKAVFRKKLGRKQLVEFFATYAGLHRRHGSVRRLSSHGSQAGHIWPPGQADFASVRPAFREVKQERLRRCRGDLRSRITTNDEVRDAED
ncbi:transposase [Paraburkholderia sp. JPY162]|uniref:Transposase n=1 Tax=Paraburkholderia youngii TaxID=2782701 RepID=A0A7W8P837_9BURK|nr:transposase [Paraburkholderia youngii]